MASNKKIGTTATKIYESDGYICIKYHNTDVVKFNKEEIILNSGRYKTKTTKMRMNQVSYEYDLDYVIYQEAYEWLVNWYGKTYTFYDGMILTR